jgi:hypothetical protein
MLNHPALEVVTVSAYRMVRLFCDGHGIPTEAAPRGYPCNREFTPEPGHGFLNSLTAMRALAAEAGWTYVRWPGRRYRADAVLDKDFCPDHKPPQDSP